METTMNENRFAQDFLRGAAAIAGYMFGDPSLRRAIYHLWKTSNPPFFLMGSMICARKSVLEKWIEARENRRCPQA
jgi:hypothetical protein